MVYVTLISVLIVIYMTWTSIDGRAYRSPERLLFRGLVVSGAATMIKSTPVTLKSLSLNYFSSAELDFAAALVDPTLIGLGGGLIASAVMLKVQILNASELAAAKEKVARTFDAMQEAERADDDLKLVAKSLPTEEFWTRLRYIKEARMDSFLDHHDAKSELKRMSVPGLSGNNEHQPAADLLDELPPQLAPSNTVTPSYDPSYPSRLRPLTSRSAQVATPDEAAVATTVTSLSRFVKFPSNTCSSPGDWVAGVPAQEGYYVELNPLNKPHKYEHQKN